MLVAKRNMMSGKKLPYERVLDGLRSYGRQYMDLGFKPSNEHGFRVEFTCFGTLDNERIIGSYSDVNGRFAFVVRASGAEYYYGWNTAYNFKRSGGNLNRRSVVEVNYINDRALKYAGITNAVNLDVLNPRQNWNCLLFANTNTDGTVNAEKFTGVIHSVKISKGNQVVMDLIPVMSYDGNPEMYDKIGKKFIERHGDFGFVELAS